METDAYLALADDIAGDITPTFFREVTYQVSMESVDIYIHYSYNMISFI